MRTANVVFAATALAACAALASCTPSTSGPAPAPEAAASIGHAAPAAVSAPAERPKRSDGPVAPASKDAQTALLVRLCQQRALTGSQTDAIVKAWFDGPSGSFSDDVYAQAPFSLGDGHDLYIADVDNDGKDDWIITAQNIAGPHDDGIDKVFAEQGGKLVELPFMDLVSHDILDGGSDWHTNTDVPLLRVDKGVTYLSFRDVYAIDAQGQVVGPREEQVRLVDMRYRYLWKDGRVRLVAKTDESVDRK